MSAFCDDGRQYETYFNAITGPPTAEALDLRLFEWTPDANRGPQETTVTTAAGLIARDADPTCTLRVVLAPLNSACLAELEARKVLFHHYAFPSATLSERIQSVTHSFGSSVLSDRVRIAWSHFLCKDLAIRWVSSAAAPAEPTIYDNGVFGDLSSQANTSWRTCDFYLHVRERGPSSTSSRTVTLICFGAPDALRDRFRRLLASRSWTDAVREPLLLFVIVYDELYHLVDDLAWRLADIFRPIERRTLASAQGGDSSRDSSSSNNNNNNMGPDAAPVVDFTGLHNISKTCIYMSEAVAAALLTLSAMLAHVGGGDDDDNDDGNADATLTPACRALLTYRTTMFQSTQLRLRSLEKRIANLLALSFHLVTQQDSRVMQNDSNAMKAIAVLTLVFLPATGISSVFSMPFFSVDSASSSASETGGGTLLHVAASFWIFWVVAIPLTALLVLAWGCWYRQTKGSRRTARAGSQGTWRWVGSAKPGRLRFRQYSLS